MTQPLRKPWPPHPRVCLHWDARARASHDRLGNATPMPEVPTKLDFAVIGAQKSASSFVHACLAAHPHVYMPPGEQPAFQDPWWRDGAGPRDLVRNLQLAASGRLLGIKRPDYLCLPEIPERFYRVAPASKLIVVLRNPVDRATSAYFHYVRMGFFPNLQPDVGFRLLLRSALDDLFPRSPEILRFGLYGEALERWLHFFPRHQVLVLTHAGVRTNATHLLRSVYDFLGLDAFSPTPATLNSRPMAGAYSPTRLLLLDLARPMTHERLDCYPFVRPRSSFIARALRGVDRALGSRLLPGSMPPLAAATRDALVEYYRSDTARLCSVLACDDLSM
jgi:Sulfotransferase domain